MQHILKATHRLIDSVWTMSYIHDGFDSIRVIGYNRADAEGYTNERLLPTVFKHESDDRTLLSITLVPYKQFRCGIDEGETQRHYKVSNPQHIFNYK